MFDDYDPRDDLVCINGKWHDEDSYREMKESEEEYEYSYESTFSAHDFI